MTNEAAWRAHVVKMIATCYDHRDELFYRLALPGWQHELQSLPKGGDDLANDTSDEVINDQSKEQRT